MFYLFCVLSIQIEYPTLQIKHKSFENSFAINLYVYHDCVRECKLSILMTIARMKMGRSGNSINAVLVLKMLRIKIKTRSTNNVPTSAETNGKLQFCFTFLDNFFP